MRYAAEIPSEVVSQGVGVSSVQGCVVQEEFHVPLPRMSNTLSLGARRVIIDQDGLRERRDAAVAERPLDDSCVNHDGMNQTFLPSLIDAAATNGTVDVQLPFVEIILRALHLDDGMLDVPLHRPLPFDIAAPSFEGAVKVLHRDHIIEGTVFLNQRTALFGFSGLVAFDTGLDSISICHRMKFRLRPFRLLFDLSYCRINGTGMKRR